MKRINQLLLALVVVIIAALPANAGVRFGVRAGMTVNSVHFNDKLFESSNRAGFTGGVELEIAAPLGICFDASLMYTMRNIETDYPNDGRDEINRTSSYISLPVNFKWNFGIPLADKVIAPYFFTGPEFAVLASKRGLTELFEMNRFDVSWNFGAGLELFHHLQIGASYGLGMTRMAHWMGVTDNHHSQIKGRNNCWTITAAWLF